MIEGKCHCGACGWRMTGPPHDGLVCNCTACRRSSGIWAYGQEDIDITLSLPTGGADIHLQGDRTLAWLRCPTCGNLIAWRSMATGESGRRAVAVNLRLAPPEAMRHLPLRHFDGFGTWTMLPDIGMRVGDLLF